ncbi:hypothetical protein [Sandaracinus amylolyticus]|uniref:Putative lipoprotein n=1 Tax=Sandaracinus amylolyticus TaxID=927083 RepID=A0A0F6W8V3_9BACT|nr:hypothetical protein [Sandaracinus amylolyticus]AKF10308.1 putative lipoprotein [Sandaracinus amylolyticus]
MRALTIVLASLALIACGDDDGDVTDASASDAGGIDAGAPDAGAFDAGVFDAGASDTGPPLDPEEPPRTIALEGDPAALGAHGGVTAGWDFDGDVDGFDVVVPDGGPFVLYASLEPRIDDMVERTISLGLSSSDGAPIGDRATGTRYAAIARRVPSASTVRLTVSSDRAAYYVLLVALLTEADEGELDDATSPRRTLAISPAPSTTTLALGRPSHPGDVDAVRAEVPAHAVPQVLRVVVQEREGSYPRVGPLPGDQVLRVLLGGWADAASCRASCPRDASASPALLAEVDAACEQRQCLVARRVDRASPDERASFDVVIPLPPASSTTSLTITRDAGDAAVDVESDLTLTLEEDTDEAARYAGGAEQPSSATMAYDATAADYPMPSLASSTVLRGELTYGGGAVQGAGDYDAWPSDVDTYLLQLPSSDPGGGLGWMVAWYFAGAASAAPGTLAIDVEFCDGDVLTGGGGCTPVSTHSGGAPITLVDDGARTSWHSTEPLPQWSVRPTGATVASAAQCSCIEPRFVRGGTLRLAVRAHERRSVEPIEYSVHTALTTYPRPFTGGTCPATCAYTDR